MLRVWLPLNGNFTNRGCSSDTIATATSAGSFSQPGKTVASGWNCGILAVPYTWTSTNQMSVAMWVKPSASAYAWTSVFGWGSDLQRIEPTTDGGPIYKFFGNFITSSVTVFSTMTSGAWHHVVMSADGTKVRWYLDGQLTCTDNQKKTVAESFGTNFNFTFGGANDQFSGMYNDIRVYDNAVGLREVRELSRAMVVHYPLNDPQPNLLQWGDNYTETSPLVHTGTSADSIHVFDSSLTPVTPGKTYYIQVKCDGKLGSGHGSETGSAATKKWTLFLYRRYIGTSKAVGGFDAATNINSGNLYFQDQQQKLYVFKWTAGSNDQDIVLSTNIYSDDGSTVSVRFWDFKIEADRYTPYVPASTQAQYTSLGLDSKKVPDCSGYGNDGTVSSTAPSIVTQSPRNTTAWKFNSGTYISYAVPSTMAEATWTAWVDFSITGYNALDIKSGDPAGNLWLAINNESSGLWAYWGGVYNKSCSIQSGWHHVAFTFRSGITRWYLDGTAVGSEVDMSSNGTSWPTGTRTLGDSYTGSSWSGTPFTGSVSDFRLYATVLSADDIAQLAKNPSRIAGAGRVHTDATVYEPYKSLQFMDCGNVNATSYSEWKLNYDQRVYFEPDGSAWVRVAHHANPGTYKFSTGDSFSTHVRKDSNRWLCGEVFDRLTRWEIMVVQRSTATSAIKKDRWVQTVNPNTAAFADVAVSAITRNTSSEYTNPSSGWGGIYKFNSNTYYSVNNGNSGNWWGAIGSWTDFNTGIPGWFAETVKDGGWIDLYARIDGAVLAIPEADKLSLDKESCGMVTTSLQEG